jgi:plastocyanin
VAARIHPPLALAAALAASLVLAAPAGSHPGHGPPTVTIANLAYAPTSLTIYTGDAVLWVWSGPDTNHSVTGDDFDSDPGKAPSQIDHPVNDGFAHSFTKAGTYDFHCKVHSFMTGTVKVLPSPTPTDPSATAAPAVTKLTASMRGRRTLLSFTLSSPADLRATVRRASGGRTLKEVDFGAPPGATKRRVSFGRLRPGRYRVTLVAVDRASGLASKPVKASLRVPR